MPVLGVIPAVLRIIPVFVLKTHSWHGSGKYMWYWRSETGWEHARLVLYCCTISPEKYHKFKDFIFIFLISDSFNS